MGEQHVPTTAPSHEPLRGPTFGALLRLNQGSGREQDVTWILCTDPDELARIVHDWDHRGPVAQFRDLMTSGVDEAQALELTAGHPWVLVLLLRLGGDRGQHVAAQAAASSRSTRRHVNDHQVPSGTG